MLMKTGTNGDDSDKMFWVGSALFLAVVVALLVFVFIAIRSRHFLIGTVTYVVGELADRSGLNSDLVEGLVIILTIPFFVAVAQYAKGGVVWIHGLGPSLRLYRSKAGIVIVLYVGAFFLARAAASRHDYSKDYCVDTPEGIRASDRPGVDPIYGLPRHLCSNDDIMALRLLEKAIKAPHRLHVGDPRKYEFFGSVTGKPLVWYSKLPDGQYEFFDSPGKSPETSESLVAIDGRVRNELIQVYEAQQGKKGENGQTPFEKEGSSGEASLAEDFDSGVLDPRMTVEVAGSFNSPPGIKNMGRFGTKKAFGFGRSTCGGNCFGEYATRLIITFPTPTFINTISYKEMEIFGNWGSGGHLYIDGVSRDTFGREPYNDRREDTAYRSHVVPVKTKASTVEFKVVDITNASEIYIDDLVITTGTDAGGEVTVNSNGKGERSKGTKAVEYIRSSVKSQEKPRIAKTQSVRPQIASVSPVSPQAWQDIVIKGTHFGTNPPFNGCTDFIVIRDVTANRAFPSTGPWGGCNNPILVTSWTDNEIKVEGLPAYQRGQPAFTVGDTLKIEVRNPQENWNSPAWYPAKVSEYAGPGTVSQSSPTSSSPKAEEGTHILSVTPIATKAWQRIVITGMHFGASPPINGCPDFIRITDLSSSRTFPSLGPWGGCANPILIASWTDTKIVIEGFPAYQRGQDAFTVGDTLKVELRSPQENWAPLKWYSLRVT